MNLIPKIIFVLSVFKLVELQEYLFQTALISYKETNKNHVRAVVVGKMATIDHHRFASVTNLKVSAKAMKMYEGAVKNLPYLEVLRLKECGIRKLSPKCLQNLPKLEEVYLQDNDINVIEEGVFNYLPIRVLRLHRNEISVIRSRAFDNMPNLETIRLNSNAIAEWDPRWLFNTPKLHQLYFKRNSLSELPARAFVNIKTSHKKNGEELVDTQMFFSSNNLTYIHPEAFHGIDSLFELDLRNNLLENLNWRVFSHMTVLQKLNLSRNSLTEIDEDAFEKIEEFSVLDLSKNRLECVPYEIVSKTKVLSVRRNNRLTCDCLLNLWDQLDEEDKDTRILHTVENCAEEGKILTNIENHIFNV